MRVCGCVCVCVCSLTLCTRSVRLMAVNTSAGGTTGGGGGGGGGGGDGGGGGGGGGSTGLNAAFGRVSFSRWLHAAVVVVMCAVLARVAL
jgi:hypothetical protein